MPKKEEGTAPEATPETPPEAPTPEQQLEALRGELDAKTKQLEEIQHFADGYQGLQKKYNTLYEQSQKQSDLRSEIDELRDTVKILAVELGERGNAPDDIDGTQPKPRVDIDKKFDEIAARHESKRQQQAFQGQINAIKERTEAAGLTENDPEYWDIEDAATQGRFQKAEAILKRIEAKKETPQKEETPVPEENKETEEERIARLAQEKFDEMVKNDERFRADRLAPTGAGADFAKKEKQYIDGEISLSEYREARKEAGLPA